MKKGDYHINQIANVIRWCHKNRWEVVLYDHIVDKNESEAIADLAYKTIHLFPNGIEPWKVLYILLHECGHVLINKKFNKRYYYNDLSKSFSHLSKMLDEEYEAWDRGLKLAKRFKIKINEKKWDNYKNFCIKSYVKLLASNLGKEES